YFTAQFNLNSETLKRTWKLIGLLINRKKGSTPPVITKVIYNEYCPSVLNTHFINVGSNLSAKLPPSDINQTVLHFVESTHMKFKIR
ncbi:unnamed protein product, partial [Porites evermanni]